MAKLIALEGIDGSGKSTQTKNLAGLLQREGARFAQYHYTSKDNFWGDIIRRTYSNDSSGMLTMLKGSPHIQELLYALSARSNLRKIRRVVRESELLLSDRSVITAYASHIDKMPQWFLDLVEPNLVPNVAIYLDIPPEAAWERIGGRTVKYEDENLEELNYFRRCYERIMGDERPKRLAHTKFTRINALDSEANITEQIHDIVKREVMQQ